MASSRKVVGEVLADVEATATPFLKKLLMLVSQVPEDVGSWDESGSTFIVKSPAFEASLKRFFKGTLQTFVRQLHFYGFSKNDMRDSSWWYFSHPKFKRDQPHLIAEIRRKTYAKSEDCGPATKKDIKMLKDQIGALEESLRMLVSGLGSKIPGATSAAIATRLDQVGKSFPLHNSRSTAPSKKRSASRMENDEDSEVEEEEEEEEEDNDDNEEGDVESGENAGNVRQILLDSEVRNKAAATTSSSKQKAGVKQERPASSKKLAAAPAGRNGGPKSRQASAKNPALVMNGVDFSMLPLMDMASSGAVIGSEGHQVSQEEQQGAGREELDEQEMSSKGKLFYDDDIASVGTEDLMGDFIQGFEGYGEDSLFPVKSSQSKPSTSDVYHANVPSNPTAQVEYFLRQGAF